LGQVWISYLEKQVDYTLSELSLLDIPCSIKDLRYVMKKAILNFDVYQRFHPLFRKERI